MTMHIVRPSVPPLDEAIVTAPQAAVTDLDSLGDMSRSTEKVRVTRADEPGPDADRVLVIGGGTMGADLDDRSQRFARRLARHLAQLTGRGATVFEVVDAPGSIDDIRRVAASSHLERFDAVVLTTPSRMPIAETRSVTRSDSLRQLVVDLLAMGSASSRVVLTGVDPRTLDRSAATLFAGGRAEIARRANADCAAVARIIPGAGWAPLHDLGGRNSDSVGSAVWCDEGAQRVAVHLALTLANDGADVAGSARWHRNRPQDDHERVDALRASGHLQRAADPLLDELVSMAARIYGTTFAGIQLIDEQHAQAAAAIGSAHGHQHPRDEVFCNTTVEHDEALVVGDATADSRFAQLAVVRQGPGIRFYAGLPIEAVDGHRIGTLCVLDPVARDPRDVDLSRLRDIAQLAQRRLRVLADDDATASPGRGR